MRAKRSDFSVAANSVPSTLCRHQGGRHDPRQDQDETGRQSVQEPAGIKQNYHALRTRASVMKVFCVIGASVTVR
jgi:hypothetical protein